MTKPDDRESATQRMLLREAELMRVLAWARGTGDHAGRGPCSEGKARLTTLLEEPPSEEELADIERSGWSPVWRKNAFNFASFGFHIFGKGDFVANPGSGLAVVDPDADPQPVH